LQIAGYGIDLTMNSSATMQQGSHCDSNPDLEQRANNFLHLCLKMCQGDRDIEERTILRCRSEGSNQPQLARNIPFCESRTASAPASTNSNGKKKVRFFNEEGDEQHKGNIHLIYTESKKFKMFRTIPDEQIKACVSRMTTKCFRAGEMVIKSGTFGASLVASCSLLLLCLTQASVPRRLWTSCRLR